jgi:hypothetical protein
VELGAKDISSVGLDGGAQYDNTFSNLNGITLLKNGQESFDASIKNIERIERHSGVKLKKV